MNNSSFRGVLNWQKAIYICTTAAAAVAVRAARRKRRRLERAARGHLFRGTLEIGASAFNFRRHLRHLCSPFLSPRCIRLQQHWAYNLPGPSIKYNCLANSYCRRPGAAL